MSRTFLKVRLKELAGEAKIIRREERESAERKAKLKHKQGYEDAYEYEIWRFNELKHHRKTIVRQAARETQIAYAFLRGKQWNQIERFIPPAVEIAQLWQQVGRLIAKYGITEFHPLPIVEENIDRLPTSLRIKPSPMFSYELFYRWVHGEELNRINRE